MQGIGRDYLIAQGLGDIAGDKKEGAFNAGSDITVAQFFETLQSVPKKTFRLGPDGVSWTFLPAVTAEMKAIELDWKKSLQAKGQVFTPLTGDISFKYEWSTMTGPPAEDDEGKKPTPEAKEMVEDVRLACMVDAIDTDTSVVPVGAFILNSSSRVVANPYFRGLDLSSGLKLESYMHLRKPALLQNQPISERAVLSKSTHFLDSLTLDQPKVRGHRAWPSCVAHACCSVLQCLRSVAVSFAWLCVSACVFMCVYMLVYVCVHVHVSRLLSGALCGIAGVP